MGLNGVASEFATFGLFLDTTEFFYSVFNSVSYLLKMILAHHVLLRDPKLVKRQMKVQMLITILNAIISGVITIMIIQITISEAKNKQFKKDLTSSQLVSSVVILQMCVTVSIGSIMKNFNYLGLLSTILLVGNAAVGFASYYWGIVLKMGFHGVMQGLWVSLLGLVLDVVWLSFFLDVDKQT